MSELLQDRNYAEAIKAIDEAVKGQDASRDYLGYLKGRALELSGQYDAAVDQFTALEKQFPKSDWARRARFGKAVAFARKGDFRSAELIYRAEVEYLLSADPQAGDRRPVSRIRRCLFQAQGRSAAQARLSEGARILSQGPGGRPAKRPPDGGRAASGPLLSTAGPIARGGEAIRAVRQGPSRLAARDRSPLPPGRSAACPESAGRGPPHLARPARRAWHIKIGADSRRRPSSFRRRMACRIRRATKISISASPPSNRLSKNIPITSWRPTPICESPRATSPAADMPTP